MKHPRHVVAAGSILLFGALMVFLDLFVPIPIILPAPVETRSEAVRIGRSLIGTEYQFGGNGPDSFDCSGLMVYIFQEAGKAQDLSLPFEEATSHELAMNYTRAVQQPETGDMLFFSNPQGMVVHTALLLEIGEERYTILEATSYGGAVEERIIRSGRSDIHSIARIEMLSIW